MDNFQLMYREEYRHLTSEMLVSVSDPSDMDACISCIMFLEWFSDKSTLICEPYCAFCCDYYVGFHMTFNK